MFRTLVLASLVAGSAHAQVDHIPHIEVTGNAEMEVVPDQIHIAIILRERGNGNNKITVEKQELELKEAVQALGIQAADLTLRDAMADLVPKKFREDDVIARKGYMLKVGDAETVRKVFLELDRLQIEDASIHHVSHSREVEFRREMRIKAVADAKEKADYLLAAIGERTGAALEVIESPVEQPLRTVRGGTERLFGGHTNKRYADAGDTYQAMGVGFSRITISARMGCVFAILPK